MNQQAIVVDLFYLPPIEFFVAIDGYDTILIEKQDYYQKQTYRNRTVLQLANKVATLSVPVIGGNKKVKYKDILIDYSQKWKNIHLRGIQSAYGKAPYFEYFFPEIQQVFVEAPSSLYTFNLRLLTLCLGFLKSPAKIEETAIYGPHLGQRDLRGQINAKEPYQFRAIYEPYPYTQLFGLNFVPNLGILDLLFCEGPRAREIIYHSKKK